jgi:hypothetical protein
LHSYTVGASLKLSTFLVVHGHRHRMPGQEGDASVKGNSRKSGDLTDTCEAHSREDYITPRPERAHLCRKILEIFATRSGPTTPRKVSTVNGSGSLKRDSAMDVNMALCETSTGRGASTPEIWAAC